MCEVCHGGGLVPEGAGYYVGRGQPDRCPACATRDRASITQPSASDIRKAFLAGTAETGEPLVIGLTSDWRNELAQLAVAISGGLIRRVVLFPNLYCTQARDERMLSESMVARPSTAKGPLGMVDAKSYLQTIKGHS